MKFSDFLIEEQTSQSDVILWFHKNASMSVSSNGLHWNTRDKTLHLSSDCTISNCDVPIPYLFSSCPNDFTLMNSHQTDLPFSSRSVVLSELTLENVKGLMKPIRFPGFIRNLKIRECPDLVELVKLPDISGRINIMKCPKLKTIRKISGGTEIRLTSLAITKLPKFENTSNFDDLTIGGCKDLDLDFATAQQLTSVTGLFLGDGFSKTCSVQGIHKSFPNLKSLVVGSLNSIQSHILNVLKIDKFEGIRVVTGETPDWIAVINKHIGRGNDGIFDCQSELLDHGYDDLAQL